MRAERRKAMQDVRRVAVAARKPVAFHSLARPCARGYFLTATASISNLILPLKQFVIVVRVG